MWRWVGIAVGVLIALMVAFIVGMYIAPVGIREATRDIFVIVLGLFQLVTVILLTVLLFAILYAVNQINKVARGSLIPKIDEATAKLNDVLASTRTIADNARDTSTNVSGSTAFVTERVVSPIIRLSSLMIGVRAAATSLARRDASERVEQELGS